MKYGRFITYPGLTGAEYSNPWTGKDFNSYSIPFEPGKGILSVKREFAPEPGKDVDRILLRATALGIFDLFVNGNRVTGASDGVDVADELKPGWTDYRKRVFEFEYDITEYCSGQQTDLFVAEVSPGWWTGRISFGFYGYRPCAFCGEIEIVYADGQSAVFASEEDWDVTIGGPVLRADIWDGEYYDATVPEPSIHPEAHEWKKAEIFAYDGAVEPASGPRIRSDPDLYLRPVSAVLHSGTEDNGTEYGRIRVLGRKVGDGCEKCTVSPGQALILDLGQNMVGRPLLLVRAERGVKISLYFAEMLNTFGDPSRGDDGPEGSMYIKNYRSARARVVYVAAGTGETEYYFPTHSFFGFRYVEVRADGPAELVGLCGEVIRSAVPETGDFYCDDPEVNRLFSNIVWGMRGNYLTAPTDCPQRDERLGWTGDTQVFSGAASYIGNIDSFMHKWLGDARHSQEGFDGAYCDVIPRVFKGMNGNAGWTDAGIIVPYRLWEMYGDTDIINEHYDSMEKYMEYLTRYGYDGPNTAYGDWLSYEPTDKRYIAVCYYYHDAKLMEEMSRIAGRADRAGHYAGLAAKILEYWTQKYRRGDLVSEDTQTGCLLPLAFDMADGAFRDSLVARLRQKIVGNGYTLSTGFIGTGLLCDTLSKVGEDGLAYSLLLQTRDPSWLYSVRQGATTVWERWNSYTKERGFGDVGMNSFNHYAYGCVAAWMFSGICGIRPDRSAPGFSHFILRPTPDLRTDAELPEGQKRIDLARATYEAVSCQAGDRIESGWERVNGDIVYSFVIPEGLSATASLPAGKTFRINGLDCSPSDLGGRVDGGRAELELGPGAYEIVISY